MNNSRILKIKNAILSEYYFYLYKLEQIGNFKICISGPLNENPKVLVNYNFLIRKVIVHKSNRNTKKKL